MSASTLAPSEPLIVAVVYDRDGKVYDQVYTWQAGQTYAREGYRVVATAKDAHLSKTKAQSLYNQELAAFRDCFGRQWHS